MLRAHQQLHPRRAALGVEQFEDIRFPIAHRDHPRPAANLTHGSRNVRETVQPTPGVPPLLGRRRPPHRRIEAQPQHTERKTRIGHRQRRVQMQPQALRPGLVLPDHLQPVAARTGAEVQIRSVLDRQHRALAADPLHAALPMRRQDVRYRNLRLGRHLDQTVERIDRGAVAGAVGVDLLTGIRRQKPHALHQPRRQPLVPQGCPSKLVPGPVRPVQTLARAQRWRRVDPGNPELPPPVPGQFIQEDRLHRLPAPLRTVLATTARGLANTQEVGRPQAGPIVARIGKALHEPGTEPVARSEILRQPPQQPPQHMARQMRTAHRRADQEAAQTHHPVEMIPALLLAPRDPAVARRNPQRSGGKACRAQPAMRRTHQVADLAAGKGRHPVWMLPRHQCGPQGSLRHRRDQPDVKGVNPSRMRRNLHRLRNLRRKHAGPVARNPGSGRRQNDLGRPLGQRRQRLQAAGNLRAAQRIDKRKLRADPATQRPPAVEPFLRQDRDNPRACRFAAQTAADLRLYHRGKVIHDAGSVVQPPLS